MMRWVVAVDGDREAEPDPGDGGVHADHLAALSTSGPPELPGLSAASVWITLSITARRPARRWQRPPER